MKHFYHSTSRFFLLFIIILITPLVLTSIHKNITLYNYNTNQNKDLDIDNTQKEILAADTLYVETFGDKDLLTMYATKKIAILTCMDSRIDPAKIAGLKEGDAYVIRNAGGRASDDAIRSLIVSSKLLGTKAWFVIHHNDCGMEKFTDTIIKTLLEDSLEIAICDSSGNWFNTQTGNGSTEAFFINWLTINNGLENGIVEDVRRIRNHPLVSHTIPIYGYIYDVHTGKLIPVPKAMEIGKAPEQTLKG